MTELEKLGAGAKKASRALAVAGTQKKNDALYAIQQALLSNKSRILQANAQDMAKAESEGLKKAFLDRLLLTDERICGIADAVAELRALADPIGEVVSMADHANGLTIGKKRVPLGVIAIIFEARPNVTVDAAALCLKSGNACILRGGREAIASNSAMVDIMREALVSVGLPEDCICLVRDTSRDSAKELMGLREYVDVL
ncbi:MAG: aldehyde dehydrogenase family protein, partial [Oscillospiraceae bacterium]